MILTLVHLSFRILYEPAKLPSTSCPYYAHRRLELDRFMNQNNCLKRQSADNVTLAVQFMIKTVLAFSITDIFREIYEVKSFQIIRPTVIKCLCIFVSKVTDRWLLPHVLSLTRFVTSSMYVCMYLFIIVSSENLQPA